MSSPCPICCSVVKVSAHLYSLSLNNLQWLAKGNNWKYLFLVPSRVKAYQQKKGRDTGGGRNTVIEEFSYNGIKIRFTDQDDNREDWISEEAEEGRDASGDTSSSASNSEGGGGSRKASCSLPSQGRAEAVPEEEFFARSRKPRHPRPTHVKYRIGQVVKHRKYGYYGVIVGWDEVAKVSKKHAPYVSNCLTVQTVTVDWSHKLIHSCAQQPRSDSRHLKDD